MTTTLASRETAFREALEADPDDCTLRLIFADWLDEEGRDVESNGQRWQARNRQWPRKPRHYPDFEWWRWLGFFPDNDFFETGCFEATLPLDVWSALSNWSVRSGRHICYDTLRDAEIALALALFSLDL